MSMLWIHFYLPMYTFLNVNSIEYSEIGHGIIVCVCVDTCVCLFQGVSIYQHDDF